MGIKIEQTSSEFPVLDIGAYEMVIVGIEAAEGMFGPQLLWKFRTTEPEEDINGEDTERGLSIWGYTSQTFSSSSKAFKWTAKVLNRSLEGYDLDTDDLVGQRARVRLDVYEKEVEGGKPEPRNKVIGVDVSRKFGENVDVAGLVDSADENLDDVPF